MFLVTKPSSVARHGTIAGTHVRHSRVTVPTLMGLKRRDRFASSAVGQRVSGIACLTGFSGCHISCEERQRKAEGNRRKAGEKRKAVGSSRKVKNESSLRITSP